MAAGPGIRPLAAGAPRASGRSTRNYPRLVADALNLDLVDVTFSGATTAHLLSERQRGVPPQIDALDGWESLVTVTIGGNDVGYVPLLMAATLPGLFQRPPVVSSSAPAMPAGSTIHGQRGPGRWERACRGPGGHGRFTPTPPVWLRLPSWSPCSGAAGPDFVPAAHPLTWGRWTTSRS